RRLNVIDLLLIEHRDLVEKFEKRGFNCRYTPNGVSMDFYNIEKSGEKNFLPTLIFVGKCGDKRKNAEEFIKSLASLDRTIEWKAYFLGGETEDFIHWFESNVVSSLRSRCTFFGEVSDVKIIHRIYSESHIFVMTSKQEGYPLSLAEACWVGCFPILSINSGGKDLSSRGVAEIYYDQENLSFLLNKYITDLNLTTSLGEMAEHEVKKYNDWRVLFDELKGFINE
ncbi:TPA: glycosyltransferase, partial [Klebsiella pneumoniae]|nr:glycosyltransferase [Klebsiella pneumoniae]